MSRRLLLLHVPPLPGIWIAWLLRFLFQVFARGVYSDPDTIMTLTHVFNRTASDTTDHVSCVLSWRVRLVRGTVSVDSPYKQAHTIKYLLLELSRTYRYTAHDT